LVIVSSGNNYSDIGEYSDSPGSQKGIRIAALAAKTNTGKIS
jgi:hypothetical protein